MLCSTIRDIIVRSAEKYGTDDAIRYKKGKKEIEAKTYQQLKDDSEKFSAVLKELEEQGKHIALTGTTSYEWIITYLGITNSGSVAVPLDVSLPAEEMCELIDRADTTVFVIDEIRADVLAIVREKCPQLKYVISMQKTEDKIQ